MFSFLKNEIIYTVEGKGYYVFKFKEFPKIKLKKKKYVKGLKYYITDEKDLIKISVFSSLIFIKNSKKILLKIFLENIKKIIISKKFISILTNFEILIYKFNLNLIKKFYSILLINNSASDIIKNCFCFDTKKEEFISYSIKNGILIIDYFNSDKKIQIKAHKSEISLIQINNNSNLIATSSIKGTIIRVFQIENKIIKKKLELRRGTKKTTIISISFSENDKYLACISKRGTIHVFDLLKIYNNSEKNISSYFPYFGENWSYIKFKNISNPEKCKFFQENLLIINKEKILLNINLKTKEIQSINLKSELPQLVDLQKEIKFRKENPSKVPVLIQKKIFLVDEMTTLNLFSKELTKRKSLNLNEIEKRVFFYVKKNDEKIFLNDRDILFKVYKKYKSIKDHLLYLYYITKPIEKMMKLTLKELEIEIPTLLQEQYSFPLFDEYEKIIFFVNSKVIIEFHLIPYCWKTENIKKNILPKNLRDFSCSYCQKDKIIFLFGGLNYERSFNKLYKYSRIEKQWEFINLTGEIPLSRYGMSLQNYFYNNKKNLILFGGTENEETFFNDLYLCNLKSYDWKPMTGKGTFPISRYQHLSCITESSLFILGGKISTYDYILDFFEYSFIQKRWKLIQSRIPYQVIGFFVLQNKKKFIIDQSLHCYILNESSLRWEKCFQINKFNHTEASGNVKIIYSEFLKKFFVFDKKVIEISF